MSNPVQRLLELAELQHALVTQHRFEELAPVHAERDRVLATLPAMTARDGGGATGYVRLG